MEEGISLFSSLLNNKHFLIVFVHALEQQKDFAVRDRSGCEALGEGQGPAGAHTACQGSAQLDPCWGRFANYLACWAGGVHPALGPHVPPFPGPGCLTQGPAGTAVAVDIRQSGSFCRWV